MMNQALQIWREHFDRQPVEALDRLVRGVVALGSVSQLSIGELLDLAFEPGDEALDAAVKTWLADKILQRVPESMTPSRWTAVLDEFLRGIATLGLPQTGQLLREEHGRIRLWLRGLYEGSDRDPEGSYLLALAYCQSNQRFSQLWRRLVLGEEMPERLYRDIGLLGFRKMPDAQGHPGADVPAGLLQALLELASRQVVERDEWQQIVRCVFAAYRRTEDYWVRGLRDVVSSMPRREQHIDDWLATLLPRWRRELREQGPRIEHAGRPISLQESQGWVKRVAEKPDLCGTDELERFLDRHRAYAQATGDSEFLVKTFNNLASRVVAVDPTKAPLAISWIEEALDCEPTNPHNWTTYAQVLWAADRRPKAMGALWEARQRLPWNPFVRSELGRLLRDDGELETSLAVYREAAAHFPSDVVCRASLAETLREMGRLEEAREVYEQACRDFPGDAVCRTGLGDLLINLDDLDQAEVLLEEALVIDRQNPYARSVLAEVWFIKSARTNDISLRDRAKGLLEETAEDGNRFAQGRLRNFDQRWEWAVERGGVQFEKEPTEQQRPATRDQERALDEMSDAERLGRAMIALWQAERDSSQEDRNRLCDQAERYLNVAEAKMDGLLAGFVETRGLVLLAKGDARAAMDYFTAQITRYGRGGWIGVRLGEQRARLMLGEAAGPLSDETPFDSKNVRFALQVANVIRRLAANEDELAVGGMLRRLYPRAASLAKQWTGNLGEGEAASRATADESVRSSGMIAAFIQAKWFRSVGITSQEDLNDPQRLNQVLASIRETQNDAFDVLASAASSLAA